MGATIGGGSLVVNDLANATVGARLGERAGAVCCPSCPRSDAQIGLSAYDRGPSGRPGVSAASSGRVMGPGRGIRFGEPGRDILRSTFGLAFVGALLESIRVP